MDQETDESKPDDHSKQLLSDDSKTNEKSAFSFSLSKARASGSGGRPLKGTEGSLPAKPAVDLPSVCCSTGTGGTGAVSFTSGKASSSSCPAPNRSGSMIGRSGMTSVSVGAGAHDSK